MLLAENRAPNLEIKSPAQVEKLRAAGRLAAQLLNYLEPFVKPGVTTEELDRLADEWTTAHGATSAPYQYVAGDPGNPFPKHICTSVNEVVCHGIPSPKHVLKDGDIINLDVTPILDGWFGDTSKTFLVGNVSERTRKLVDVTRECMMKGIEQVKAGSRMGDIGEAIEEHANAHGFSVVRQFVGHGIGQTFHMPPQVPHYGKKSGGKGRGGGVRMQAGMTFTIEPMINEGKWQANTLKDGWTAVTADGKLSAQFEHTVVVTETGFDILTLP